jgi:hypothetical protein
MEPLFPSKQKPHAIPNADKTTKNDSIESQIFQEKLSNEESPKSDYYRRERYISIPSDDSQAAENIVQFMETVVLENGQFSKDPPDVWQLIVLEKNIKAYKREIKKFSITATIANSVPSLVPKEVKIQQASENAIKYYKYAQSLLSVGDKEILSRMRKETLVLTDNEDYYLLPLLKTSSNILSHYRGPFVGIFQGNRDPNPEEDFPGINLECKEGFYIGVAPDNMPNGWGQMKFYDGAIYTGFFKGGVPHGENGTLTLPKGIEIKSNFIAGLPDGKGILVYENSTYQGIFKHGMPTKGDLQKICKKLGIVS